MSITKEKKVEIVKDFGREPDDTGSPEVQIAILSDRVGYLTEHFKTHKKDYHSRMGLLKIIAKRRKLLKYLRRKDIRRYKTVISKLNIRDKF
ncbi:MAG: 30S ribosomal protein S15 [Epsilonproteobacteria bacterium]|nr:30S ribosomal protein S15 [Campylobacterota bacterium]